MRRRAGALKLVTCVVTMVARTYMSCFESPFFFNLPITPGRTDSAHCAQTKTLKTPNTPDAQTSHLQTGPHRTNTVNAIDARIP